MVEVKGTARGHPDGRDRIEARPAGARGLRCTHNGDQRRLAGFAVIHGIAWPVLGVTDLERSLDFYCGVLGFRVDDQDRGRRGEPGPTLLTSQGRHLLLEPLAKTVPSRWVNDDLQRGMRHVAFKVDDIERWAGRVREAGARFTMEPRDAFGGVRIAFFLDPDGAHLELVQGNVGYTLPGPEVLVAAERGVPAPRTPRFDHVALSVADLEATLHFYRRGAGAEVIGELRAEGDPRGFRITYLQAGPAILELFSYDLPLQPNPWRAGEASPGLLRVGLACDQREGATAALLAAGGAPAESGVPHRTLVLDPDGTPLELATRDSPLAAQDSPPVA